MKQKSILTRLFMLSLGLLLSVGAMAQRGQENQTSPEDRAARMVAQYQKQLSLTTEQTQQLQDVMKQSAAAIQELRANTGLSRPERMGKMKSLRDERDSKVKALLTDEQKKQYDALEQKRAERQRQRGTGQYGGSGSR